MVDRGVAPRLVASPRVGAVARATLLARLKTIQLLTASEHDIALLVRDIERDPLFTELLYPRDPAQKIVRFQSHPRTSLIGSFYELNEAVLPRGAPAEAVHVLTERNDVLPLIQRLGRDKFERYFLKADGEGDLNALALATGLSRVDIDKIRDFLLTYSIQAEFFDPSAKAPVAGQRVVRIAHVAMGEDGEPYFEFSSPLLARGRYDIHYDRLHTWVHSAGISPVERRRLKAFVRRLELINWRQNTLYRILDVVCHAQRFFLAQRDRLKMVPVTQRQLAKRLAVAPSTINRAIQGRCVVMPWGEEVMLEDLFCSRKSLCLNVLNDWDDEAHPLDRMTDEEIGENLTRRLGFPIPRRTINSYRHQLGPTA